MIRIHISPDYLDKEDAGDGGIRRVSEAMIKHLPAFGIEHVRDPKRAQIIANHGAMLTKVRGVPMVSISHGLYWSRQAWGTNFNQVNESVVESMRQAIAHTAPSKWVARAIRRGGFWYPEVIYHGIDADDFIPSTNSRGFVLWNKARADYVSDPKDVMRVAGIMPNTPFVTTIGREEPNVKVIGTTNFSSMKQILSEAGVYLCTARETFGIGTLEAMAYGVPVAGWDWGGQHEIIVPGETGYLAPPGDYRALSECIARCLNERARLGPNCIEDVRKRWRWEPRIEQYADIFKRIYKDYYQGEKPPKVSIIVTAYKLDQYLPQCLDSVMNQTFSDFECLVVDDAQLESTRAVVDEYRRRDPRIRYLRTPNNLGLPGSRNFGVAHAKARYIRHLDADDFLAENAINLEASALDADSSIHIVYGHIEVVNEDGSRNLDRTGNPERSGWPHAQFSWMQQMAHLNQIPSCAMVRREVFERSGGYRVRMKRNEDAEFWCRVTSLGFRAFKITEAVTYFHRMRNDSKGAQEWAEEGAEPDWTAWFPWRIGSTNLRDAQTQLRRNAGRHPAPHLVPFGAQGTPGGVKEDGFKGFWYVHDHAYPVVSVIVTCGPGHEDLVIDALDSIQAQTYPDWECILVNDTGKQWGNDFLGAPWAQVVNMDGNQGASAARNEGYKNARGRYIIWLDADDYWLPWYLEVMVAHAEKNDGVIYPDLIMDKNGKLEIYRYADFVPDRSPIGMQYPGSSVLVPRKIVNEVISSQGGWDVRSPGMEDWDYQVAIHALGFCAYHVPEPLFVYRMNTSTKRERDYAKIDLIRSFMDQKWFKYRKGGETMTCGCSTPKKANNMPSSTMTSSGNFDLQAGVNSGEIADQMVIVEYVGPLSETFSIKSRVSRDLIYRFGNNPEYRERTVFLKDAEYLVGLTDSMGVPLYRQVSARAMMATRDPAAFIGQPVVA